MFKNTKIKLFRLVLKISAMLMVLLACIIFLYSMIYRDNTYVNIEENGQRIKQSIFYKYDGKIYALIPSDGYYLVEDADADSFKVIKSENSYNSCVGIDKNYVYFGNKKIENLNPKNLYSVGNDYYSDGENNYFCSSNSERNKELSVIMETFQSIVYVFFKDKKPQSYIYPYKELTTKKPIKRLENLAFFATNGDEIYYEGEILKNANVNTIKKVSEIGEYFCDEKNVYYKNEILPIKNSGELEIVKILQGDYFLYDRKNGDVFNKTYRFDKKSMPYKIIGNNSSHAYNIIFTAKDGIYFYNSKSNKQEKAGDNNFNGEIKHLTDNVFCDDDKIYYLKSFEKTIYGKHHMPISFTRHTLVVCFDEKFGWEKVTDIESGIVGSVWVKDGKYYYFDNLGNSQLVNDTVYEIIDKNILKELLSDSDEDGIDKISVDRIREIIKQKKIEPVSGETKYNIAVNFYGKWNGIFFMIYPLFIIFSIFFARKNKGSL